MTLTAPTELPLTRTRWRVLGAALLPLFIAAALVAYALALDASGLRLIVLAVLLVAVLGWPVVASLMMLPAQLTGSPPTLTGDGVRLRLRPWHRRLVTIPWAEITMVWVEYLGRRPYLRLSADPRGAHADEWDPRGDRYTRRFKPLSVYLPKSVRPEQARAAVAALSGGAVLVADRGPDAPSAQDGPPDVARLYWRRRKGVASLFSVPAWAAVAVAGIPLLTGVAPPWNQPWWPGVEAAVDLPDACKVFTTDRADALGVTGSQHTDDSPLRQGCRFTVPQGELTVTLEAFHPVFSGSSAEAAGRATELAGTLGAEPRKVSGVGEEAWLVSNPQGTTTLFDRAVVRLVARRANVVLTIMYGGEKEPDNAQTAVIGAAQAALNGLDVH